jgi:hypothetical protein
MTFRLRGTEERYKTTFGAVIGDPSPPNRLSGRSSLMILSDLANIYCFVYVVIGCRAS